MPTFVEPRLQFSISIPESWAFLPPAWSPIEHFKKAGGPDDWIQLASKPFCCAMSHHDSQRHPYPTLQVTARPFGVPSNAQARQFLDAQVEFLRQVHTDFQLERATHEAVVSGHRANQIFGNYTLLLEAEEGDIAMRVRSRSYVVFTPGLALTLALSGSEDPAYCSEVELDYIINSVRIGPGRQ